MIVAPPCADEESRLEALLRYKVLDTEPEGPYDDLVALAADICQRPIALISLVDKERQWFKAKVGIDARQTERDVAFCAHAIHQHDVLMVPNALEDERFCDNPLVAGDPHIRFYAGAPLITPDGHALGTLCVIDQQPGELSAEQTISLQILARQVVSQLELRLSNSKLRVLIKEKDNFIRLMSHDLRSAFGVVITFSSMLKRRYRQMTGDQALDIVDKIHRNSTQGLSLLDSLLSWSCLQDETEKLVDDNVDLTAASRESIEYLADTAQEKGVAIKLDSEPRLRICVNGKLLRSVIQNLLHNAIKFSKPAGEILLQIGTENTRTCITVTDHGVGMPQAKAERLFSSAVPSSKGTNGELGSGVGTQLIRDFVDHYRGNIKVRSAPDAGTSIKILLPARAGGC